MTDEKPYSTSNMVPSKTYQLVINRVQAISELKVTNPYLLYKTPKNHKRNMDDNNNDPHSLKHKLPPVTMPLKLLNKVPYFLIHCNVIYNSPLVSMLSIIN